MNYTFVPQSKLHDHEQDETANQNFDKIFAELRRLNGVLQAYSIDLAADVTGILPVTALGATSPGSATKFLNEQGVFATISSNGGDASGIRTFFSTHVSHVWTDMGCLTSTIAGSSALQSDTGGQFQRFTTAASANVQSGWRMTGLQAFPEHDPDYIYRIRTGSSVANIRLWVGGFNALPVGASDVTTNRAVGFRFSTVAGDTGWKGFYSSSSSVMTFTPVITSVVASTIYDMRITVSTDGTLITFTINGVTETLVPSSFTGAGLTTLLFVGSDGTAAAKFVDFCRCHVETN